jgi:hypothetical protein
MNLTMHPSLRFFIRSCRIALEALFFTAIMLVWLSWTIGGESPTRFIYSNF